MAEQTDTPKTARLSVRPLARLFPYITRYPHLVVGALVFGWLTEGSGDDLVAGAELLASSEDGFMPFRARPESLKRGLIARIPTLDHLGDTE